ncbi:MAG: PIG-L family deacetylase [Candidatus Omnitrophica bacterium]|jgi:LmbE family N-acetylglucosaminyl deacetylase|nr:PIG-L family deacetylase [Candidatus Omnitrophota bacterium]
MNILAIGSHPDDIEFGCGGTLLKYSRLGHNVSLMVITDGSCGADGHLRMGEQEESARFMGAKNILWGGLTDTQVVDNHDLILKIEDAVKKTSPDIVFLNYYDDVHQDHRAVAQAGLSATRYIKEVLFYEVPTTLHFEPDIFVDIHEVLEEKVKLLSIHASQIHRTKVNNLSILESIQACATFRGYQGRIRSAEGFKALRVLRSII